MSISLSFTKRNLPSVTVAIPSYNEADHIEDLVRCFLTTQYYNLTEILVADGGSTDETQDIVSRIATDNPQVKLLQNPGKIQSSALNLMLKEAKGDIFLRADAHSEYAPDYIEKCVEALLESEALNVGGSQLYVSKTSFQAGVALASRSFLNGGAKYRNPEYNGYSDTVYLGCFRKQALLKISEFGEVFDTTQVTNQDAELNLKLIEQNENAIYVSSDIKVWYYPRTSWQALCKQFFKYGRGRYLTATKHPQNAPLRSKIPFFFVTFIIFASIFDLLVFRSNLKIIPVIIAFGLIPLVESMRIVLKFRDNFESEFWRGEEKNKPPLFIQFYFCFLSLVTMPIAYGLGHGYQLVKNRVLQFKGW